MTLRLYGQRITRGLGKALPDQLYEILRREILRGRWKAGERIPSYKALTALTGLSQTPIQAALQRLADDGYVERVRHKGVFVKCTHTPGNSSLGELLIAIGQDEPQHPGHSGMAVATQVFGLVNVLKLQEEAGKLGLRSSIVPLPSGEASENSNGTADRLADGGLGIVSLLPAGRLEPWLGDSAPAAVYLGTDDPFSTPALTGDLCMAAYLVTRRLLDLGHRRIAALPCAYMTDAVHERAWAGMAHALGEAGVPAPAARVGKATRRKALGLTGIRWFLEQHTASTAVLCFSIDDARRVVEVAESMGAAVPRDLSVASLQTEGLGRGRRGTLLGAAYDWKEIIRTCFEILLSPDEFAERSVARIVFSPRVRGETTAAPPSRR